MGCVLDTKKLSSEFYDFLTGLRRCRLCWRITGAIFLAFFLTEAVIFFFLVTQFEEHRLDEVEHEGLVIARAIIRDARTRHGSLSGIANIGPVLGDHTALVGMQVYDESGTPVGQFGEFGKFPASLPPLKGDIPKSVRRQIGKGPKIDVIWPSHQTGTPYSIAARIDTMEVEPEVNAFIWKGIGLAVLVSVIVTVYAMLVLERLVLRPIRRLHDGLTVVAESPYNPPDYRLSEFGTDELREVTKSFDFLTSRLHAAFGQLSQFHARLTSELTLAVEMQEHLMPTQAQVKRVEDRYGVQIASHFRPSSELGGDFWWLNTIDEDRFGIMNVDFSGHGISAALNTFRLHTLLNQIEESIVTPAGFLEAINSEIAQIMMTGQFCTMIYVIIDVRKNILTYSGTGAPPPIFGQFEVAEVSVGDAGGLPVGIKPLVNYENRVVEFPENSYLFLYSDALFETECHGGDPLEIDGVISLVEQYRNPDADAALDGILSRFFAQAPDPLPDDLTAVWLSR